jgi:mono/diheme cytochrome c family protein
MTTYQKSLALAAAGVLYLAVVVSAGVDGKAVYNSKCASCHGKDGKGNSSMSKVLKVDSAALDLTDTATTDKSKEELIKITHKGVEKMPAYEGKLSGDEISASVAYSLSLAGGGSKAMPSSDKKDRTAVKGIYQSKCASCHGKDGKGNPAMSKVFKVDKAALDLTDIDTQGKSESDLSMITKTGEGKMPAFNGKVKDSEIDALSGYIKSLGGK